MFDRSCLEIADLQSQVESLHTNCRAAEEYASSLKSELGEALRAADALARENRRIGHQTADLNSENRRLRKAAQQMGRELLVLNKLLEPLCERMERQRQHYENELERLLIAANALQANVDIMRRHLPTLQPLLSCGTEAGGCTAQIATIFWRYDRRESPSRLASSCIGTIISRTMTQGGSLRIADPQSTMRLLAWARGNA